MQLLSSQNGKARNRIAVNSKLEKRLLTYVGAATAAGVGILANPGLAEAKIVYTKVNDPISPSVALDLNHDGIVDFNLTKWVANASIEIFSYLMVCHDMLYRTASHQCLGSTSQANAANVVRLASSAKQLRAQALPFGAPIGPGQNFGGTGTRITMGGRFYSAFSSIKHQTWYGPWMADGAGVKDRYLGFKFKIGNEFHFGWARVTVTTTSTSGFSATLTGYAYETIPGKAIRAGQTTDSTDVSSMASPDVAIDPQGSDQASLGMLSLGATVLSIWRREDS